MQNLMKSLLTLILIFGAQIAAAEVGTNRKEAPVRAQKKVQLSPYINTYRGWDYLVEKLKKDGISELELRAIYLNKKMPPFTTAYFRLAPKESHAMYTGFSSKSQLKLARNFISTHKSVFDEAERKYKVNRYVIASIMLVESHFGSNVGNNLIINRLSRVGSIGKPDNVLANYEKLHKEDRRVTLKQVQERATYLESRFYPEVLALLEMAKKNSINLLELKGSSAGAFGIPQFLPSTFLRFGQDGNKDGRISLFTKEDAVLSTAHYLSSSGWQDNGSQQSKEEVIWKYNHSEPYIETVLSIAYKLSQEGN